MKSGWAHTHVTEIKPSAALNRLLYPPLSLSFLVMHTHISTRYTIENRDHCNQEIANWHTAAGVPFYCAEKIPVQPRVEDSAVIHIVRTRPPEADTHTRRECLRVSEREEMEMVWWICFHPPTRPPQVPAIIDKGFAFKSVRLDLEIVFTCRAPHKCSLSGWVYYILYVLMLRDLRGNEGERKPTFVLRLLYD